MGTIIFLVMVLAGIVVVPCYRNAQAGVTEDSYR